MKTRILVLVISSVVMLFARNGNIERHDIPFKTEEELSVEIDFGVGNIELRDGTDKDYVLESEMEYSSDEYKPDVDYQVFGKKGKLQLAMDWEGGRKSFFGFGKDSDSRSRVRDNIWKLEFTKKIPIFFDIEMGLGTGEFDFSGLNVQDIDLECGMSDVVVEFNEENKTELESFSIETGLGNLEAYGLANANVERFDLECGLGSAVLDFSGKIRQNAKVSVTVGLGSVTIQIPKNVGVEIEAEQSFLSSIDLDDFYEIDDDLYRSDNWDDVEHKIYMSVEVGLGSIDIDWIK